MAQPLSQLIDDDAFYAARDMDRDTVAPWEDGMRTDGKEGSFEWWYADVEFDDGTTVVAIFFAKNRFDVPGPAHPTVHLNITLPDGTSLRKAYQGEAGVPITAAKDKCDVQVGPNRFYCEDDVYYLDMDIDGAQFKATMTRTLPAWRPKSGQWGFGEDLEKYFAWVVALPAATFDATLTIDGKALALTGTGYHDHNWGNAPMSSLMNHWYWGRAKVGDYSLIVADIISEEKFGNRRMPLMMVAKDGAIAKGVPDEVTAIREKTYQHPETGKFIDDHLIFEHTADDGTQYRTEFLRQKDILVMSHLDRLPPEVAKKMRAAGANPTYIRCLGDVRLTVTRKDDVEVVEQEGLWEQMFFGANKDAVINS